MKLRSDLVSGLEEKEPQRTPLGSRAMGSATKPSEIVESRANGRILTREQAIAIFQKRVIPEEDEEPGPGKSGMVAKKFGVSPKTVRDVWNKTTWVEATCQFWTEEERRSYSQTQQLLHLEMNQDPRTSVPIRHLPVSFGNGKCPVLRAAKKRGRPMGAKDKG